MLTINTNESVQVEEKVISEEDEDVIDNIVFVSRNIFKICDILKPTKAKGFKDLKKDDLIYITISVKKTTGGSNKSLYATYAKVYKITKFAATYLNFAKLSPIKDSNLITKICTLSTNELLNRLRSFKLQEL